MKKTPNLLLSGLKPLPKAPSKKRRFGQNFLKDESVKSSIIHALDAPKNAAILELGPGAGAISQKLCARSNQVHAIELDHDWVSHLQNTLPSLDLIQGDGAKINYASLNLPTALYVVGNLPYNAGAKIILQLLRTLPSWKKMVFMLELDVAHKLCAQPWEKLFSRLSASVGIFAHASFLFPVPPSAFSPMPKVDSGVFMLTPKTPPEDFDAKAYQSIVDHAFRHKRKTLSYGLKGLLSAEAIENLGIDPKIRAERLTFDDFLLLVGAAKKIDSKGDAKL